MPKPLTKLYTDPCISPAHPTSKDVSKKWIVWFRFYDSGKWKFVKRCAGINYIKDFKEKVAAANALKEGVSAPF
jgi:hypothetical protein